MNIENLKPGDWYVAENGLMVLSKGGGEYSFIVADCQYKGYARLIAAAPDLLRTITDMEHMIQDAGSITLKRGSLYHQVLQEAIKNATI